MALVPPCVSIVSATEQRRLAPRPKLEASVSSWQSFPRRAEAVHDDHLGFREDLIRNYVRLSILFFGESPSEKLILGQKGWLFFGDRDAIAHYRGVDPLSPRELLRWERVLEERRDWLAERGIAYLLVLVPDKHQVYAEFMPERLSPVGVSRPLDQLVRHLNENSDLLFLDLRPTLESAKLKARIYHRTDTHWNDLGAYTAYSAIIEKLAEVVPEFSDQIPIEVDLGVSEAPGLGLAQLVGLSESLREEVLSAQPRNPEAKIAREHRRDYQKRVRRLKPIAHGIPNSDLPRAIMFRDSFGNALIPYLSEHFQRILYVWDRDVDPRIIQIEKPQIVIQQIVGRLLERHPRTLDEMKGEKRIR